jgi:hypothetical protein
MATYYERSGGNVYDTEFGRAVGSVTNVIRADFFNATHDDGSRSCWKRLTAQQPVESTSVGGVMFAARRALVVTAFSA